MTRVLTSCLQFASLCGICLATAFPTGRLARLEGGPMNLLKWASFLLCPMVVLSSVHAQGVGSSGDIAGTISDSSEAGIPKATILALETDKGIQHTIETDSNGEYRLSGLPPATYDVTAKVAGFQTAIQKRLILTVGATVIVNFQLKVASASE